MSRSIGDVFLTVRADLTQFQADLTKLNSQVSRSTTDLGNSLGNVGRTLSTTGASLTRNLTLPLVAAGAAATHFALDFDTQMRQIVALTDVTEEQIGGVTAAIEEMAPAIGKGPQELAEAFYFVASAGFEAAEAMEVLEIAAKASAAGMGSTQDVARVLAGVINAYGHENLDAATAADQLTAAIQKGSAEAADFAGVIGRVAPGAAALGVSFDQVTAALAGMTNVGISADEAATSLVQIFSSLLKPTTQADAALEGLGLSAAGLRRQLREEGLIATLRTLEAAFGNNETAAAAVFGNIRALRGVTALLTLDTAQLDAIFASTADSAEALSDAYEETEGPQRELDRAVAQFEVTMTALGADVLPVVVDLMTQLAGVAKGVADAWAGLDEGTRKAIVQSLALAAALGPVLFVVGKLTSGLGSLFKVVGALTSSKGLPSLTTRISIFLRSFGRVAPVLMLIETLLQVPEAIGAVGEAIDGFASGAPKKVIGAIRTLNDAIPSIFNPLHDATDRALDELERQFEEAADLPEGSFSGWGERTGPMVRPVEEGVELIGRVLEDGSVEIGNAAEAGIEDPIAQAAADARAKVSETLGNLLQDLESSLAATPDQIEDELQAIVDALADPYTNAERLADIRGGLISDALRRGLTSGDERLETQTFNQTMEWLHQWELLDPKLFTTGSGFLDQLTGGMESNLQTAVDWVEQKMGIDFVSQWDLADQLEDKGYLALAAFVRGMETQRPTAEQKARASAQRINTSLSTGADWYGGGEGIAVTWANGLSGPKATAAAKQAANRLLLTVKPYLIGDSPPPLGPLSTVDEGGEETGIAWAQGLAQGLAGAVGLVEQQMAAVAGGLAPGFTGPTAYPGQPVTAGVAAGAPYGASTPVPGATVNNFNLHVTGRLDVDAAQDALEELRRLQSYSLSSS